MLKNIIVAEEAYRGENDKYVGGDEAQLSVISFAIAGSVRRYEFSVADTANEVSFDAFAVANDDRGAELRNASGDRDAWEANHTGVVKPTINVCE